VFEAAEVGSRLSKPDYKQEVERLRPRLLAAQRDMATADYSAVILISGAEGAGKDDVLDLLHAWMDTRGIEMHALWETTDEEAARPPFWRFWRVLPPSGKSAIFFGSWYTAPIVDRVYGRVDDAGFERSLSRIRGFERMLAAERVVLIKLWLHLSKAQEKQRLKAIRADPKERWRISPNAREFFSRYDDFQRVSAAALEHTSTGDAPWTIIESADWRYRNIAVAATILRRLHEAQQAAELRAARKKRPRPTLPKPRDVNVVNQLDLGRALPRKAYDHELGRWQGRLAKLSRKIQASDRGAVLVFEGADAGGKGGAIRRVTASINARLFKVFAVAAPTDEESARPYLWRFWRQVPRRGRFAIFDRSWYGRVLVERIEGFCGTADWKRAYAEINDFEAQLSESGLIVVKFWLAISQDEQLRRFKHRELTPYKQYKLTEEDWRNRRRWQAYEAAACDMIECTSTEHAPWTLVEANDKLWARVKVLETIVGRLKAELQ